MKIAIRHFLCSALFVGIPSACLSQDLRLNQTELNDLQVYVEKKTVSVIAGQVTVDRLIGTNMSIGSTVTPTTNFSGPAVTLPAGYYNSYFYHLDGIGTIGSISISGTITFTEEIVALIYSNSGSETLLNDSDAIFGNATHYESGSSRRLESNDDITLVDAHTLNYSLFAGNNFLDDLRIITKPLQANIVSSKTVNLHSANSTDCDIIPGVPDLSVPAVTPGSCLEYVISLDNTGPGDATAFSVEDTLGSEFLFQSADFSGFGSSNPGYAEITPAAGADCGMLSCAVRVEEADIVSGGTAEIIIRVLIK